MRLDNFKIIYKILKALEKGMDAEEFNVENISHETLKISYPRWEKTIILLVKAGYIEGVIYTQCSGGYSPKIEKPITPILTIKGLEYLEENSLMKKAKELVILHRNIYNIFIYR